MRFDEAIPAVLDLLRAELGEEGEVTLVRDVAGQITAVLEDRDAETAELDRIAAELHGKLGPYSPGPRRVLLRRSDLIDEKDILESPDRVRLPEAKGAWLVDRLLTNQEWLRRPQLGRLPCPVATAFSLKGGVGRSSAVAVWAWHLARQGKRVAVLDLDLEAPGLGSLLLGELPACGMIDWLVEALVKEEPGQELLDDCLAFSPVAEGEEGVIRVIPAFGERTSDYIAKVGRVYLPGLSAGGEEISLGGRVHRLITALAERPDPPDVVLLDSRAGLHDIGAALVTQLGAEVFLFARNEPQSWQTYRLLFEHLSRSGGVQFGMPDDDLRWRLKMVAAQVDKTEGAVASWLDASYGTWLALYDDEDRATEDHPAQTFVRDEPSAPHHPLTIYFDAGLRGLELVDPSRRPPWPVLEAALSDFLDGATERLLARSPAET